jgi:hypothetical protein
LPEKVPLNVSNLFQDGLRGRQGGEEIERHWLESGFQKDEMGRGVESVKGPGREFVIESS